MTGPAQSQPLCHKASEVAAMLGISEWWIKEQARRGRIPYAWLGGSYRFTDEHVREIVRLFEVQPAGTPASRPYMPRGASAPSSRDEVAPVVKLRSRPPRRLREAAERQAA
jgi:Helix-turn-helix domain